MRFGTVSPVLPDRVSESHHALKGLISMREVGEQLSSRRSLGTARGVSNGQETVDFDGGCSVQIHDVCQFHLLSGLSVFQRAH